MKEFLLKDFMADSLPPNGLHYRRLGREKLGNGNLLKFRKSFKNRAESQPSGAHFVRWLFPALFDNGGKLYHC